MGVDFRVIGRRIKEHRRALHRTQDNLAEHLSVSVGYVSRIERGATKANLETLARIAQFLGCDLAELICGAAPFTGGFPDELSALYSRMTESQRRLLIEIARAIAECP